MTGVGPGIAGAAVSTGLKVGFGVLEKSVSAAYGVVSKTAGAVGNLAKGMAGASEAMKSAGKVKNQNPESPIVIINNTGMAGRAGKQKVAGSGTLPPLKTTATPQVSEKMPTEALLDTAVKYLSGIDKTLKAQLEFERRSFEQQARDERESQIESKPSSFSFSDIKNRLSGFGKSAKDTGSTLLTAAKWAAGIGITASLIASALNPKELEELKKNIEAFKEKFSWLSEIPAGGLAGFLLGMLTGKGLKGRLMGGLKGGIIGIVTSAVANVILARATGGEVSEDTKSVLNLGAAGAMGYLGYRGIKSGVDTYGKMKAAGTKISGLKAGSTVYDPKSGRMRNVNTGAYAATNTATGFLKSPRWQKFLNWLTKRGERALVTKIQQRIAIAVTTGAITATGVGAAFGAIGFLLNLGFSLYFMYEIYQLWKEFTSEEDAKEVGAGNADLENELNKPDATKVGGAGVTPSTGITAKSETGRPEEAQAFFESKGWSKEQAAGIVGNLFVESGLRTDAIGDGGKAYGIAQWHPDRQLRFQQVYGKPIKESSFNEQLEYVNWELNNSEKRAGQLLRNTSTAEEAAAVVDQYYERSSGAAREQRMANAGSIIRGDYANLQGGGGGGSSGGMASAIAKGASATLEATGKLFGAIGSAIVKPGIQKPFTPSTGNVSERINNDSMKIQNDITFGIKNKQAKDAITNPPTPGTPSTGGAGPMKSISSMDPNYSSMDVVKHYVAHFRLAAA